MSKQKDSNAREIMHIINAFLQDYNRSLPEDNQQTVDQLIDSRLTWHEKVPALRKFTPKEIANSLKAKEKNGAVVKAFAFKNLYHAKGGSKDPFYGEMEGRIVLTGLPGPSAGIAPPFQVHPALPTHMRQALTSISLAPYMSSNSSSMPILVNGNINITNNTTNNTAATTTTTNNNNVASSSFDLNQLSEKVLNAAQIGAERGAQAGCELTREHLLNSVRKGGPASSIGLDRNISQDDMTPTGCKKLFCNGQTPEDNICCRHMNPESTPEKVNLPYKTTGLVESPKKMMSYFLSVVLSPSSIQYRCDSVRANDSLCNIDQELMRTCFLSIDETLERPGDELDGTLFQVKAWETINEMLRENSFLFPPAIQVSHSDAAVKLLQALLTPHSNPPQDLNNGLFTWLNASEVDCVLYFPRNDFTDKEEDLDIEYLRQAFGLHSSWTFALSFENDLEAEISIAIKRGETGRNLFDILITVLEGMPVKEVVVQSPSSESSVVWGISDKSLKKLLTLRCKSIEFAFIRFDAHQCAALGRSKCPMIFRQSDFDDRGTWIVDSAKVNNSSLQLVSIPGFKPKSIGFKERIPTSIEYLKQGMSLEVVKDIAFENINWYERCPHGRDIIELCDAAKQSECNWQIQAPNSFEDAFSGNTNALSFIGCKWIVRKFGIAETFDVSSVKSLSGTTSTTNTCSTKVTADTVPVASNLGNAFITVSKSFQNENFEENGDVGFISKKSHCADMPTAAVMTGKAEDNTFTSLDPTDHREHVIKSHSSSPPALELASSAGIIAEETSHKSVLCDTPPADGSTFLLPRVAKIPKTHKGEPCKLCMSQYRKSARYCSKHQGTKDTDLLSVDLI